MLLYTTIASSRLQYTISFIESIIGQQIIITTDKEYFLQAEAVKINYSAERIATNEYHIIPHTLLFSTNVIPTDIVVSECRNNPCFFTHQDDHGFDVFACLLYTSDAADE